ncbi:hypothetical protein HanIR_Chr15g0770741 [Helianthus annuus]|nr:hypothetical protein HanIR_Chr15g0770741 [Helianthus annuus]
MYSNNAPQSFAPGGLTGFDQDNHQPTSQIQATGDVYSQAPSQGDMGHGPGNSNNQFQGLTGYRGTSQSQPTMIVGDTKAPGFSDLGPDQGSSYNHDPNISRGSGGNSYGQSGTGLAPSLGDIRGGSASQTSDGHVGGYSKDGKAPGISDVDRRGSSETGASEAPKMDVPPDAQEFVGISLVGKNFRKFYPNAYYREQDEENQ